MKLLVDLSQIVTKLSFVATRFLLLNLALALLTFSTFAQTKAYTATDRQVSTLLTKIESKTDSFQRQIQYALDRSIYNNTNTEFQVNAYLNDFANTTDNLRNNFNYKISADIDVENLLKKAAYINDFMKTSRLDAATQSQWTSLRNDLNTLAKYYNVGWNWNNNTSNNSLPYTASYSTIQNTIANLERNTVSFKTALDSSLDNSSLNNTQTEDMVNRFVSDFENSTYNLKTKFQAGNSNDGDVENVLNKGYFLNGFVRDYSLSYRATNQWNNVKNDLNSLARYYAVATNWNQSVPWNTQFDAGLDGTYRLNPSMSDNVNLVIQKVVGNTYGNQNTSKITRNLQKRLNSPEYLAIDKNGNNVTIASNGTGQATFQADGISRTEYNGNRQVKVTGKTNFDSITLSYEGDKVNDYYVSFVPMTSGKLRVVRRVNLENRNETVTVTSVYDKINTNADFSWVSNQGNNNNDIAFYIPNGTQIEGTLNENLSTRTIKNGDKFSINVTSPSQYAGATIFGNISGVERSGRISGRANMTFNFEQIRLANGQLYEFRGIVEQVTNAQGKKVNVNNEGVIRDGSQTNKTIIRSGIGAGVGAIIGAIIGGGDGAAIGAGIGGAAGAGSVIAQGRDDLNLEQGSQIVISASAPASQSRY